MIYIAKLKVIYNNILSIFLLYIFLARESCTTGRKNTTNGNITQNIINKNCAPSKSDYTKEILRYSTRRQTGFPSSNDLLSQDVDCNGGVALGQHRNVNDVSGSD